MALWGQILNEDGPSEDKRFPQFQSVDARMAKLPKLNRRESAFLFKSQAKDSGFAAAEFQGAQTFGRKAVAGEFRVVHAVPEVVDGALGEGEDEFHAHFLRFSSGKFA